MYARLVFAELSVYPDTLQRVSPVLESLKSELGKVKGLESYTLFHDWDRGEVGIFAVWQSKDDEQRAWEQIKDKLNSAKDIMWRGRPLFKLFDVYEHGPSPKVARTSRSAPRRKRQSKRPNPFQS